ncbi:hypothetical protein FACS1894113_4310 [Alphaproteobacteria bacterium]|nr:hypothetical protein FACS1894113_4310 [Alphaproteobacteria bacterium]
MMTIYLLFEALRSGKISFNTKFKASKLAICQSPTKLNLRIGEKILVIDIIRALAIKSANDAAVVAAEGLCGSVSKFCELMNKKARQLGMKNTHFENPSGLPNKKQITTAHDILTLGLALINNFPQYWYFFSEKSFTYNKIKHNTHCKILRWYNGAEGAKTGYTYASGFNLFVTAAKYNKSGGKKAVLVVVMGGDSAKRRDLFAAKLLSDHLKGYDLAVSKASEKVSTEMKKQRKSLFAQVVTSDINEIIVHEEEEFAVEELLKNSAVSRKYWDELYETDEEKDEAIKIEEEIFIKPHFAKKAKREVKKAPKKRKLRGTR